MRSRDERKKKGEIAYAQHLLEHLGGQFLHGCLESIEQPYEPPDVALVQGQRRIGIEVYRLLKDTGDRGSRIKAREELHQRVVNCAKRLHQIQKGPPLNVAVYFEGAVKAGPADVDLLANQIANMVLTVTVKPGQTKSIRQQDVGADWPKPVSIITVRRCISSVPFWWAPSPGDVPDLSADRVREEIARKEHKLRDKWQLYAELWLLLVIRNLENSSFFRVNDDLTSMRFDTRFDRVFILDLGEHRVYELLRTPSE